MFSSRTRGRRVRDQRSTTPGSWPTHPATPRWTMRSPSYYRASSRPPAESGDRQQSRRVVGSAERQLRSASPGTV